VFEVLLEAWTLRRKIEKKGLKRRRNESLRIVESNLASSRIDMHCPLFYTVSPNEPKYEDVEGKALKRVLWRLDERSSSSPVGSGSSLFFFRSLIQVKNTKPPMCFRLAREGGRETKTTRLMA
ncbi:hypothetical protein H5410_031135, partial [Solanum commersonii]